jgi:NADP-dependent 3-hydroxy acid dehydrogenase YdfG
MWMLFFSLLCCFSSAYASSSEEAAFLADKKIVIVGGTGGLGSELARTCIRLGVKDVTLLARNVNKARTMFTVGELSVHFKFVEVNVGDSNTASKEVLTRLFEGKDIVIECIGLLGKDIAPLVQAAEAANIGTFVTTAGATTLFLSETSTERFVTTEIGRQFAGAHELYMASQHAVWESTIPVVMQVSPPYMETGSFSGNLLLAKNVYYGVTRSTYGDVSRTILEAITQPNTYNRAMLSLKYAPTTAMSEEL